MLRKSHVKTFFVKKKQLKMEKIYNINLKVDCNFKFQIYENVNMCIATTEEKILQEVVKDKIRIYHPLCHFAWDKNKNLVKRIPGPIEEIEKILEKKTLRKRAAILHIDPVKKLNEKDCKMRLQKTVRFLKMKKNARRYTKEIHLLKYCNECKTIYPYHEHCQMFCSVLD